MTVTDATDSSAIAGATVQISGPQSQTATSGADGTAPFSGIPAGGYNITVSKTGYLPATGSASVASSATNTATVTLQMVHAALLIQEVTFSGNHVVDQDTLGPFATPDWVQGRGQQNPVCYTRNSSPQLTAKFRVTTHPSGTETVQVRGTATLGSATLQWIGSVSVAPGDNDATTPALTSSAALPNQIGCFDPANITWEFNPAGTGWGSGEAAAIPFMSL